MSMRSRKERMLCIFHDIISERMFVVLNFIHFWYYFHCSRFLKTLSITRGLISPVGSLWCEALSSEKLKIATLRVKIRPLVVVNVLRNCEQ